jgi:hypothetical protein
VWLEGGIAERVFEGLERLSHKWRFGGVNLLCAFMRT